MAEKKYIVIDDGFTKFIEDTTLFEDKHEGHLYDAYEMCRELNKLSEENEQLRSEIQGCKIAIAKYEEYINRLKHKCK